MGLRTSHFAGNRGMNKKIIGIMAIIVGVIGIKVNVKAAEPTPVPMILDVDMATDVDDATAVRICSELTVEGLVDLKGVAFSVTPNNGNEVRAMEGALDYMGLTTVPIGQASTGHYDYSPYYGDMWQFKTTDHVVYKNAVNMYKDILRSSPTKVRITTTGFLLNIAELLKDPEGFALVQQKVDGIYIAGGEYSGMCWNLSYQPDVTSATMYVIKNSPVPLYFAMDILGANQCGGSLTKMDKNDSDYLSKCFHTFGLADGQPYGNCDGTAVYCCAMQNCGYCGLYKAIPSTISVAPNGYLIQTPTDPAEPCHIYILETTVVKGKEALCNSKLYTNTMDAIINADYLRRCPQ